MQTGLPKRDLVLEFSSSGPIGPGTFWPEMAIWLFYSSPLHSVCPASHHLDLFVLTYPCPKLVSDLFLCDRQEKHTHRARHVATLGLGGEQGSCAGQMTVWDGGREGEDCHSVCLLLVSAKGLRLKCWFQFKACMGYFVDSCFAQLVTHVEMLHCNNRLVLLPPSLPLPCVVGCFNWITFLWQFCISLFIFLLFALLYFHFNWIEFFTFWQWT